MIVEAILQLLILFIPEFTSSIDLLSAFTEIVSFFAYVSYYFDVEAFLYCVGAIVSTWVLCSVTSFFITIL